MDAAPAPKGQEAARIPSPPTRFQTLRQKDRAGIPFTRDVPCTDALPDAAMTSRTPLASLEHHDAFIARHIGPNDAEVAHMLRAGLSRVWSHGGLRPERCRAVAPSAARRGRKARALLPPCGGNYTPATGSGRRFIHK